MNRHTLQKLIHTRTRDTDKNAREMYRTVSVDAVHDFRVAVKKERAILRLMSVNKVREIKIPADLKRIYRKAGEIRELHVLLINNKKRRLFSRFQTNQWRQRIKTGATDLKHLMKGISLNESRNQVLKQLPLRLSGRDIEIYFSVKLDEIKELLFLGRITAEIMHNIRKLIKDLLYSAQILEKEAKYRLPQSVWNRDRQEYFAKIATELGEYHDRFVESRYLGKREKIKIGKELQKLKKQLLDSMKKNI